MPAAHASCYLSVTHAAAPLIKALVANARAGLQHVLATAPQLPSAQRWQALVRYIVAKILDANRLPVTAQMALALGEQSNLA